MEAKEKAYEIFNNCCDYADYTDNDNCFTERETMYKNAKHLAIIVVSEVLTFLSLQKGFYDENAVKYFTEVKGEIINIEICNNNLLKFPKKYTEKDIKYAYEQGKLYHNVCYKREFDNVISIINNKQIK